MEVIENYRIILKNFDRDFLEINFLIGSRQITRQDINQLKFCLYHWKGNANAQKTTSQIFKFRSCFFFTNIYVKNFDYFFYYFSKIYILKTKAKFKKVRGRFLRMH